MSTDSVEKAALVGLTALAGITTLCEELRKRGLLDEEGTSRVEVSMQQAANVPDAPIEHRHEVGEYVAILFARMRRRTPASTVQ